MASHYDGGNFKNFGLELKMEMEMAFDLDTMTLNGDYHWREVGTG